MPPRVLLLGAGRFGRIHLDVLRALERRNLLKLAGVVEPSPAARSAVETAYGLPVYSEVSEPLLRRVDAVDIVTPCSTHLSLVKSALDHASVLVEKPLAGNSRQAAELAECVLAPGRVLMVGHIYRFHPVVVWLRRYLARSSRQAQAVEIRMTNPAGDRPITDLKLEFLHPFDMLDDLFGAMPAFSWETSAGGLTIVHLQYASGLNARVELGRALERRVRTLELRFFERTVHCDLAASRIELHRRNRLRRVIDLSSRPNALETELRHFLRAVAGRVSAYPDASVGRRVIEVIETVKRFAPRALPRIAVIGGGVFGMTCAAEAAAFGEVSLFERHADFMSEASFVNQYRHHWGYHYPRSDETVEQCRRAQAEFEPVFGAALIDAPSYYCIGKRNTMISGDEYLRFCERNGLPITESRPPAGCGAPHRFAACLKTPEKIYSFEALKRIATERLGADGRLHVHLGAEVARGRLQDNGRKALLIRQGGQERWEEFDFVVNATYASTNRFAHWFGFPVKPLLLSLKEILLIRLPLPRLSVSMWIGNDFATLMATADEGIFTFAYMPTMMLETAIPADGLPPKWRQCRTRRERQLRHGRDWLPILKHAEVLESRFITLGVNAWHMDDFARTSDISDHGFGCWSVLGGKIITCVSTARDIARRMRVVAGIEFARDAAAPGSI